MYNLNGEWEGYTKGTNDAKVFALIKHESNKIEGTIKLNDPIFGVASYSFYGAIEEKNIKAFLTPNSKNQINQNITINNQSFNISMPQNMTHGKVTLNAKIINENSIEGLWDSTIDTGGKVFLNKIANNVTKNVQSHTKNSIFVSYSHNDKKYLERLQVHLKPLIRNGNIELWDDTKIKTGDLWKDEISKSLEKSTIAILLISADFLASDFINENELPAILEKAEINGTKILQVIVKPCSFNLNENLSKFQALNSPSKSISSLKEHEQEEQWNKLTEIVHKINDY